MPAFQLHFPAQGLALNSSRSRMKTDEELLHDDLTKRDARRAGSQPSLKPEPRNSHKEVGTFHFHRTELLGDGSALLLNLKGVQLLHKGSIEQIDARSKYPRSETWGADQDESTTNVGDRVWAPHHVSENVDVAGYTRSSVELTNQYYPARILSGCYYGGADLCSRIMVEFDGGQQTELHIGDIRETPPPARGRGGDKRFLCNFTLWAPPFRRWPNDEIEVTINTKWTPGETIQRVVGGLQVQFTVPEDLEKLPWNKEKTARCFTLKMPSYVKAQEWKYKVRDWDRINREAEEQLKKYPVPKDDSRRRLPEGVKELHHSGEAKMFEDSPFPHYRANVEKANPDGTIVLSFKNGYTIQDYNPDWISDDYLDKINYRAPRGGIPYNPPEFEEGEYVNIDYERTGKPVYSVILKKNANGTYKTESRYREWNHYHQEYTMGDKVVEEETAHDIIYKEVDAEWGFRTGCALWKSIPSMEKDKQKTVHRKSGRDTETYNSIYKNIDTDLENDGILSWATWFRRSEKVKNINLTQMCLGQIDYYSETTVSAGGTSGSYIMKPAIFAWTTWEKQGELADTGKRHCYRLKHEKHHHYQWIPLKTITENDVKGIPLLEGFYKKALKNHGTEEGNADLFATYFMEFAKGRNKNTLRRWRPQEFETEEDTLEKTPEEKQYDLLLSANVRLEEKNRKMEEMVMKMDNKIKRIESRSGRVGASTFHEFDGYKEWTEKTIDWKIGDSHQRIIGKIQKNKGDSSQLLKHIALGWAAIYVVECALKYWSTEK